MVSFCAFLPNTSPYCLSVSLMFCEIMGGLMDSVILAFPPPQGPITLSGSHSPHQPLKVKQEEANGTVTFVSRAHPAD